MKLSIENALYTKAWDNVEGRKILSMIINDPDIVNIKPHYVKTAFNLNTAPIPTNDKGVASFTVSAESPVHTTVMDMRAPLGEGKPLDEGEGQEYSGAIKDFIAPTWNQNAFERERKNRLIEQSGQAADVAILQGYATDQLQPRIEAGYTTLDYLAIKAETTGKCFYDVGRGLKGGIYNAKVPDDNFVKAGANPWPNTNADIITSVMNIVEAKWLEWGQEIPMQIKFTDAYFRNVIMKNPGIIQLLKQNWLTDRNQLVAGTNNVSDWVITEENFNKYVAGSIPDFPKVTIVKSKMQIDGKVVDPWKDGVAVLCPQGYAGDVLRTDILEQDIYAKYGNNASSFTFAQTEDGLMTVMHSITPNGNLKEWHMQVMMSAVPVIRDFPWRVIIDTKTAG